MELMEEKQDDTKHPTDGQFALLAAFNWTSLALNAVVLFLAIHNLVRYNKKIRQARNSTLILGFYICTIMQACVIITFDAIFGSKSKQEKYTEYLCDSQEDSGHYTGNPKWVQGLQISI